MKPFIDKSSSVREGEELDARKVETYLRKIFPDLSGPFIIEQFPDGHSNLTYLIRFGQREIVLRRPPFGSKVKSAHDMGREYKVLSHICDTYPAVPRPLAFCEDESVVGAKFYLMERIKGVILRHDLPEGLSIPEATARQCCLSFIENLAQIHAIDYKAVGLEDLRRPGQYVERQVHGWIKRYTASQTNEIPDIDKAAHWLTERIPKDVDAVLIHNDYRFDNVILDPDDLTQIIGVLDWEMATIGDPLMDLATTLSYWPEPEDSNIPAVLKSVITFLAGALTRTELKSHYGKITDRDVSQLRFYSAFANFKNAVVLQQIYYRYVQGHATDRRFAAMIDMVRGLANRAVATIEACSVT